MSRLSAAGAAILMCLALAGLPVLAQSPSPGAPAELAAVRGTVTGLTDTTISDTVVPGHLGQPDIHRARHAQTGRYDVDDPRVDGVGSTDLNFACFYPAGDGCVLWGTASVSGPAGQWAGSWSGVSSTDRIAHILWIAEGTEAYAGWTYVANIEWSYDGSFTTRIHGMIYEGPPPPQGPLPPPVPTVSPSASE